MHHLGDHGKRAHRARADAGSEQQLGEISGAAIGGRGQVAVQAAQHHVAGADIVVRGHDEVRQQRLRRGRGCGPLPHFDGGELARDAIGSDRLTPFCDFGLDYVTKINYKGVSVDSVPGGRVDALQ